MNEIDIIRQKLISMSDEKHRDFSSKLIPEIDKETVLGVKIPLLRQYAKELLKSGQVHGFMACLPHKYHEENSLHACIIAELKSYDETVAALDKFLPFVDNWATCDIMTPKSFKKNTARLISDIDRWLSSQHTYTIRFAIGMLMAFFLDDEFKEEYLQRVGEIKSSEYYVNMMRAWFFATALAKQYDSSVKYIETSRLDTWTHNKTIQKAVESYRVPPDRKEYLKRFKILTRK